MCLMYLALIYTFHLMINGCTQQWSFVWTSNIDCFLQWLTCAQTPIFFTIGIAQLRVIDTYTTVNSHSVDYVFSLLLTRNCNRKGCLLARFSMELFQGMLPCKFSIFVYPFCWPIFIFSPRPQINYWYSQEMDLFIRFRFLLGCW